MKTKCEECKKGQDKLEKEFRDNDPKGIYDIEYVRDIHRRYYCRKCKYDR